MSASATQGGHKNGDAQKKRSGREVRGAWAEVLDKGARGGQVPGQGDRYCDVGVFTVIV